MMDNLKEPVDNLWHHLGSAHTLSFTARSPLPNGWNGSGEGKVEVDQPAPSVLIYSETGQWTPTGGKPLRFSNVYRWTFHPDTSAIRLEHLRFGADRPVYLFDLRADSEQSFISAEPHLCGEDCYAAQVRLEQQAIQMLWSIQGPEKEETISYRHRFAR